MWLSLTGGMEFSHRDWDLHEVGPMGMGFEALGQQLTDFNSKLSRHSF